MIKALTIAASFAALLTSAESLQAADLIENYRPPVRHHARVLVHTPPVVVLTQCSYLQIDYRAPNMPRREIAQVCYPPLDLAPKATVNRRGQFVGVLY